MRMKDRVCSIVMFLVAVALFIYMPYQVPTQTVGVLGPEVFPRAVSILVMLGSLSLFFTSFDKKGHYTDDDNKSTPEERKKALINEVRVLVGIVLLVSYAFLIDRVGFVGASLISGGGIFLLMKNKKWWMYLIFAAFVLVVYYIFKYLLYIQLP